MVGSEAEDWYRVEDLFSRSAVEVKKLDFESLHESLARLVN